MKTQEDILQAKCVEWHWNTYPQYRRLLHANNNNSVNAIKGAMNRAMGVVAGVSDLEFFFAGHIYFIEMKIPGGTQSPAQKEFQRMVESQGGLYYLIYTFEQFVVLIEGIQGERK